MKILILVLLTFLFFSCVSEKEIEVECVIEPDKEVSVKLTDFTSGMEVLRLETSDSCLLANIKKVEFHNNLVYILDNIFKGVYIFNLDGKLMSKLSNEGRGPGEYLSVDDFIIDKESKIIEVFDRLNMCIYKYKVEDFEFVGKLDIPLNFAFNFAKSDDTYYFQTNEARNSFNKQEFTNSGVVAFNEKTKKVKPLFDKIKPDNETQHWEFSNIFTIDNDKQRTFVSFAWDRVHYEINNEKVEPIIRINVGDKGIPDKILRETYADKMLFLGSLGDEKKHFFKLLMNNDKGMIIGYGMGYPPKECYYFNLNNNIFFTNNIINDYFPNPIENTPIFKENNGCIISVLYPYMKDVDMLKDNNLDVKEADNPILLIFKLD